MRNWNFIEEDGIWTSKSEGKISQHKFDNDSEVHSASL